MSGLPELSLSANAYTVGHWVLDVEENGNGDDASFRFDLNAPYQRGSVWTSEQRRALIKSLLMGLPVGSIVVSVLPYRDDRAHWRVVDGKQRVETVRAFVADEFTVPAVWFDAESLDHTAHTSDEVSFSQLTGRGRRTLTMDRQLPALEFNGGSEFTGRDGDGRAQWRRRSEEEILAAEAELYLLINGAGTAHTPEDLRAAAELAGQTTTTGGDTP